VFRQIFSDVKTIEDNLFTPQQQQKQNNYLEEIKTGESATTASAVAALAAFRVIMLVARSRSGLTLKRHKTKKCFTT
jgi:hypothetical protein